MNGSPAQNRRDRTAASDEQLWPLSLTRAVAVLLTDTVAWGTGLGLAGLSGLDWPGLVWFASAAAMTHLAIGQATARAELRLRAATLELVIAVAVGSGFALAVSAQLATDWLGCLVLAASAAAVSLGARGLYLRIRKARQAEPAEPTPGCTFAETLDLHWLPQLEIRTARPIAQPQLSGAQTGSRTA